MRPGRFQRRSVSEAAPGSCIGLDTDPPGHSAPSERLRLVTPSGICAGLAPTPLPSPLTAHDTAANRWIDHDEGRARTG